jgi:hypothetical protein
LAGGRELRSFPAKSGRFALAEPESSRPIQTNFKSKANRVSNKIRNLLEFSSISPELQALSLWIQPL